jgi:hypothetical protein
VGRKGDVVAYGRAVLIESKSTVEDRFSLRKSALDKIQVEAAEQGLVPALVLTFERCPGRGGATKDWAVVPLPVLHLLMEEWSRARGKGARNDDLQPVRAARF